MIGTCIALGLWTTGLLWMTVRAEKRRVTLSRDNAGVKEAGLEPTNETLSEKA